MYIYLMLLKRNQFFLLLLLVFVVPIVAYKVCWLVRSQRTLGVMCFTGHTLETVGVSRHPVIRFRAGGDSIFFNGNSNVEYRNGDLVPVRYHTSPAATPDPPGSAYPPDHKKTIYKDHTSKKIHL